MTARQRTDQTPEQIAFRPADETPRQSLALADVRETGQPGVTLTSSSRRHSHLCGNRKLENVEVMLHDHSLIITAL